MMRRGFPNIQWELEDMVAEGDKVAARFTMRGTTSGSNFWRPADRQVFRREVHGDLPTVRRTIVRGELGFVRRHGCKSHEPSQPIP
jgi:hypothetical protein